MFKKEIKFIYDFNLNEIKKLGNFITYNQLISANIHPAILQYISADIDYLIFEDRQKILRNSIFDYSGEKIQQQFALIGDEIKGNKRFSLEYVSKLILHASSFTVNFLSRPKWALSKFIFDDENHKNTTEIKQILNYLYYYGHLRRVIVAYINRKKILSLNEKEFEILLDKIDSISVESNARSIVQSSLKSMADFFNIGENSGRSTIPLKAVELFLEEKKFERHLNRLKSEFGEEDKRIGLIDCLKILDEVMFSKVDEVILEPSSELKDEIESEIPIVAETDEFEDEEKELKEEVAEESDIEIRDEGFVIVDKEADNTGVEEFYTTVEAPAEIEFDSELQKFETELNTTKIDSEIESDAEPGSNGMDVHKIEIAETEPEVKPFSFVSGQESSIPAEQTSTEKVTDESTFLPRETAKEDKTGKKKDHLKELDLDLFEEYREAENQKTVGDKPERIEQMEQENSEDDSDEDVKEMLLNEESDEKLSDTIEEDDTEQIQVKNRLSELIKVVDESADETIIGEVEEPEPESEIEDDSLTTVENSVEEESVEEEFVEEEGSESTEEIQPKESGEKSLDISTILENKNLTKVIENVFDYDIEDFALTIETACKSKDYESGIEYLEEVLKRNHVDTNSKEAEALKSVISEYFNQAK